MLKNGQRWARKGFECFVIELTNIDVKINSGVFQHKAKVIALKSPVSKWFVLGQIISCDGFPRKENENYAWKLLHNQQAPEYG